MSETVMVMRRGLQDALTASGVGVIGVDLLCIRRWHLHLILQVQRWT